jgi:N-acetylneuraminic acid mutarotase
MTTPARHRDDTFCNNRQRSAPVEADGTVVCSPSITRPLHSTRRIPLRAIILTKFGEPLLKNTHGDSSTLRARARILLLALCATTLAACGGGGGGGSGPSGVTVGGTIAGLLDGGLVLSDGTVTASPAAGATTFSFSNAYSSGASYAVTITTQPPGLNCSVSNGTGQVGSTAVTSVAVVCPTPWTTQGGKTTELAPGVYGTVGTAAPGNLPGARDGGATWTDAAGDLWLFGGHGVDSTSTQGFLNDLWKYSTMTGLWTWVGGANVGGTAGVYGTLGVAAAGNIPGARQGAVTWTDATGNFWMFGGYQTLTGSVEGFYNDLWMYAPATGLWTWEGGSNAVNGAGVFGTQGVAAAGNIPPPRAGAVSWFETASGDLWLFGGSTATAASSSNVGLADLWKYSPSTQQWTWVGGTQTANAHGVYGSIGVAATGNQPGARDGAVGWSDAAGNFWLFGGLGFDSNTGNTASGALNDVWKFAPGLGTNGEWTWVGGSNVMSAKGVYGTLGAAAAGNVPGARDGAAAWSDPAGNFWLFGGSGYDVQGNGGALNDVWEYSPTSAQWTWVTGYAVQGAPGVYGSIGASGAYFPGGRAGAAVWNAGGKFWLFGGIALDSVGALGDINDLWALTP